MTDENLERCRRALLVAAPRGTIEIEQTQGGLGKSGQWPRLTLTKAKSVQYVYLLPQQNGASLRLFPGVTLGQARVLYADATRVDRLLRLRDRGWEIKPNLHFGFASRGYAWMTPTADVERYTNYWLAWIKSARELEEHEWPGFLDEMISRGFGSEGDRETFAAAFTETKRTKASPRPGLQLLKHIGTELDDAEALGAETASALREAMGALQEPLTTR